MRNGWQTARFGDCVTMLSGGTPSKANESYWTGDIPWVSCKDMKTERLFDAEDHLSIDGVENGTRMVEPGTILIVVRGMILAKDFPVAIAMRPLAFNQDLKALQCAPQLSDAFLFYWLKSKSHDILGIADEAAHGTKRLQTDRLQKLEIRIPEIPTQAAIVAVLSAYDDLIENNTRRIKILEEMAQMLYREWFVHFRFPGYKKVKMVESELGPVPDGWEIKRLTDVAQVNERSIRRLSAAERINYIDIASVSTGRVEKIERYRFEDAPSRARRTVRHGDTIWSTVRPNRQSYALIVNPEPNLVVSTGFAVLTATAVPFSYLHLAVTTDRFTDYLTNHATGSAYPAVTAKEFEQAVIMLPPARLLERFHEAVGPMLTVCSHHHRRNSNLRATRDLLLPKLISGEIPVEAAEEALEQTA